MAHGCSYYVSESAPQHKNRKAVCVAQIDNYSENDTYYTTSTLASLSNAYDWPERLNKDVDSYFGLYPTRTGQAHLIFGWNSMSYQGMCEQQYSWMHFCRYSPDSVERIMLPSWSFGSTAINKDALGVAHSISYGKLKECQLYEDWLSIDVYGDCYVIFEIQYHSLKDDKNYVFYVYSTVTLREECPNYVIGRAPNISYDRSKNAATIGTSIAGRRIFEFRDVGANKNVSPTGITDSETLNNFLLSSFVELELYGNYGAYYDLISKSLERWSPGSYSVSFTDTQNDEFSDIVKSELTRCVNEMNSVLREFGISLYRDDSLGAAAKIHLIYGNMESLWGIHYDGSYMQGGQWHTDVTADGVITGATVGIAREAHLYTTFSRVVLEELYQCFGCGVDQWEYPHNTTTCELGSAAHPENLTQKDADMLRLVYSSAISPGDDVATASVAHNIPSGCKPVSFSSEDTETELTLGFLKRGHTYEIRAWVVRNDGYISATSDWITITIPDRPPLWDWNASNGSATADQTQKAYAAFTSRGHLTDFSHLVWNDLVDKINEVAEAASSTWDTMYATYGATKMSSADKVLTAKRFNAARQNIGRRVSTGINEVSSGDLVYGRYFTTLTEKLNEWIETL